MTICVGHRIQQDDWTRRNRLAVPPFAFPCDRFVKLREEVEPTIAMAGAILILTRQGRRRWPVRPMRQGEDGAAAIRFATHDHRSGGLIGLVVPAPAVRQRVRRAQGHPRIVQPIDGQCTSYIPPARGSINASSPHHWLSFTASVNHWSVSSGERSGTCDSTTSHAGSC